MAYWSFEGNTANSVAGSGGAAYNGTLNGNAGIAGGASRVGTGALNLDGDGDYMSVASILNVNEPWSVSAWYRVDAAPSGSTRMFVFETSGSSAISFGLREGTITNDTRHQTFAAVTIGGNPSQAAEIPDAETALTWHNVVLAFTPATPTVEGSVLTYINGVHTNTLVITTNNTLEVATGFHIGTYRSADGRWFDGAIDEVAIWSRTLTAGEVNNTNTGTAANSIYQRGIAGIALGWTVIPAGGPLGGGNTVTLTNGFGIATNVLVGGQQANIQSSGDGWAIITIPSLGSAGAKDMVIQTDGEGETTLGGGYTINAAPWIGKKIPFYGWDEGLGLYGQGYCFEEVGGILYAGGYFYEDEEQETTRYHVWAWDGASWTALGTNVNATASAMATDGTNLYVGTFNDDYVATVQKWDPGAQTWTQLGVISGASDVRAMTWLNGKLYVGGDFNNDEGINAYRLAVWDGNSWGAVGDGVDHTVFALTHDGTNLYAGGRFTVAGGISANYVAKWDGANWSALGDGVNNRVLALEYANGNLYAGGLFSTAGGNSANRVAMWNGANWSALGAGVWRSGGAEVYALYHDGTDLYCGGYFSEAGDGLEASNLAVWNGTEWENDPGGAGWYVQAIIKYDGDLFIGGEFTEVYEGYDFWDSSIPAFGIARYGQNYYDASGVSPSYGSWTGGYEVVIVGSNLCNGADITNVTLFGVNAASIVSQSATQVVVIAGASTQLGLGDVRTYSASFGMGVEVVGSYLGFTYEGPGLEVLGTNDDAIASGEAPSYEKGSDFGYLPLGGSRVQTFSLYNNGDEENAISGWSLTGSAAFSCDLDAEPFTLYDGDTLAFSIQYNPSEVGNHAATLVISNSSPIGVYTVLLAGAAAEITPGNIGPWSGGNTITVSNGYFGTITNVMVGQAFLPATLVASGDNWFTIILPASSSSGATDLIVQTSDNGDSTMPGIYVYRPSGQIFGIGDSDTHGVLCQYEFDGVLTDTLGNGSALVPNNNSSASFGAEGWSWVADDSYGGGLIGDGPISASQGSNYTIRIQASYTDTQDWNRFMDFDGAYGPYILGGRFYFYDFGSGAEGPVNAAGEMLDFYLTRNKDTQEVVAWQVVGGEVMRCDYGTDYSDAYVAVYNGERPEWRFFNDREGYSVPGGTVRRIWMWDQVLSSNQISGIYGEETSGISPESGSTNGGFTVTISGSNLGDGADITSVTLCGIAVASIDSQSATQIVVTAAASASVVTGDVVLVSTSFGETVKRNAFAYVAELPPSIDPEIGPYGGGNAAVITNTVGTITNVLFGSNAATITGSGANWVAVTVPAASAAGATSVMLQRAAASEVLLADAYTYNAQGVIGSFVEGWDAWEEVAGLPEARTMLAGAEFNGMAYAIGGINPDGDPQTNVYRFDGTQWTEVAGLPAPRMQMEAHSSNGSLYVIGGSGPGYALQSNVFRFDGSEWSEVEPLPLALANMRSAVLDNKLYVIGGISPDSVTNVFAFDGTTWNSVAGLPVPNQWHAAATLDGAIYSVGGHDGMGGRTNVFRFDGATWTEVQGLPSGISEAVAGAVGDNLYVYGGDMNWQTISNVFKFDGTTWSPAPGLPVPRKAHGGATVGGMLYAFGGYDDGVFTNTYRYQASMTSPGVAPSSGSFAGGYTVVIVGTNLSSGSLGDVTSVTLCGVAATVESVSGSTQIVVTAGASGVAGLGDVVVVSTDFGATTKSSAFTYTAPGLLVRGTNGAVVASGSAAASANGTRFPHTALGASRVHTFSITNGGNEVLGISGFGISGAEFEIAGLPSSVAIGAVGTFTVTYAPTAAGNHAAVLVVSNNSPTAAYSLNLAGSCYSLSSSIGPYAGGNTITITNGSFGTITNVLVGGVAVVEIVDSGTDWFTVVLPAAANAGVVAIVVQTSDNGDITLANAYTYRSSGVIGSFSQDWSAWGETVGLPEARTVHASTMLDGSLYVIGGFNASWSSSTNVFRFDGSSWSEIAGLPQERDSLAAATLNGSMYAIGGASGTLRTKGVGNY